MTKVLDTFLFTHEFDLLELRLRVLWPVVDKFMLMEGDHNFANKPKEMKFDAKRFEWASDKLIHIQHRGKFKDWDGVVNKAVYGLGELFVEHQHRQALYEYARNTPGFEASDIMLISDVDEIPSREVVEHLKANPFPSPILCHQDFYYYNIKCHRGKRWHGTIANYFGNDLGDIGNVRSRRKTMPYIDSNCGWHFAHFYDVAGIQEKLRHSSHQGYNDPAYSGTEHLKKCIAKNKNYLGKEDGNEPPEPLPDYLMEELNRFPLMLGDPCQL